MGSADLGLILGNGEIENPYNLLATNSLHGFISGEREIILNLSQPFLKSQEIISVPFEYEDDE